MALVKELAEKGNFVEVTKEVEENEHSLEMHLPFLEFAMKGKKFNLVPVMVPGLSEDYIEYYGKIFLEYFQN